MPVLLSGATPSARTRARPWLWFNLLSIDAPLVAVAWQLLFARCFRIAIAPLSVATLGMTVWMIYAADRLLDVRDGKVMPFTTERHRFHRDHAGGISLAVVLCFVALLFTATRLNPALLRNGLVLSVVVALYFGAIHLVPKWISGLYPKEMAVGVVFALGAALAPWSRLHQSGPFVVPVVLLALLCFLNCAAIETWEWRRLGGLGSSRPHIISLWLVTHFRVLAGLIAFVGLALFILSSAHTVFAAVIVSALAFLWLDLKRDRLSINLLRVLADVPLLSPLLLLVRLH